MKLVRRWSLPCKSVYTACKDDNDEKTWLEIMDNFYERPRVRLGCKYGVWPQKIHFELFWCVHLHWTIEIIFLWLSHSSWMCTLDTIAWWIVLEVTCSKILMLSKINQQVVRRPSPVLLQNWRLQQVLISLLPIFMKIFPSLLKRIPDYQHISWWKAFSFQICVFVHK